LAAWLEDFYVCTATGSRWQPQWKAWRRVKVSFEQLKLWYQTLDDLLPNKGGIEKELYFRLRATDTQLAMLTQVQLHAAHAFQRLPSARRGERTYPRPQFLLQRPVQQEGQRRHKNVRPHPDLGAQ
jgi:hypothetical protein